MVYDAFAVVSHNGKSNGNGHYVAFVKSFDKEEWCEYDGMQPLIYFETRLSKSV